MSTKQMMKHRHGRGTDFSKSAAGRRKRNKRGSGGGMTDGMFDRITFTDDAIWSYFPPQAYTYEVYDRESKEVIKMVDNPYFEHVDHFIPAGLTRFKQGKGRGHTCSSTAHRNQPCFSCKLRDNFYAKARADEERTGNRSKEWAPVSASSRIDMSMVAMEHILQIPLLDRKTGKARKSQAGKPLYRYQPVPMSGMDDEEVEKMSSKYGHRFHWSHSPTNFDQLTLIAEDLKDYCGNCATAMQATGFVCTTCEYHRTLKKPVSGEDLKIARNKVVKCADCHTRSNEWVALLECTGCEEPTEGQLIGVFDLRLKGKSRGEGLKGYDLQLVGVRMHGDELPDSFTDADVEELEKLCNSPLELQKVFAPDSIERQRKIFDEKAIKGIDPSMEKLAEDYSGDDDEDEDMDLPDSLSGK